ncbi:hypothetical protein WR25_08541 [Diploscapter pachys]|uniref:Uncharacterized protein n=1 Tax=Diploscapter pachys TaxID=2018661 RepID=A0A2A2M563_9BILA|nr:hypothetical protein WR25_08541 [Diploscapter pachys]
MTQGLVRRTARHARLIRIAGTGLVQQRVRAQVIEGDIVLVQAVTQRLATGHATFGNASRWILLLHLPRRSLVANTAPALIAAFAEIQLMDTAHAVLRVVDLDRRLGVFGDGHDRSPICGLIQSTAPASQ